MHRVEIRPAIVERVLARRGRLHLHERLDRARSALVVLDMQHTFVAPGAPAEVPAARDIVPAINRLAAELRRRGVAVIWVVHRNEKDGADWDGFFGAFVSGEKRARSAEMLAADRLYPGIEPGPGDVHTTKNRYSALIGDQPLRRILEERGIDTLLVAGTKTNVCCESTARDAMMLDYKVILVSDCTAALSDGEHLATLENVIQQFGDVLTADEVLKLMDS